MKCINSQTLLLAALSLTTPRIIKGSGWPRRYFGGVWKTQSAIPSYHSVPRCGDGNSSVLAKDANNIQFYIFKGGLCPFAGRTWIVLLELGLPFDMIFIDFNVENKWFLDINPRGRVPALYNPTDSAIVYESSICNEYLVDFARDQNDKKHASLLMPTSSSDRARLRLLIDMFDKDVFPPVREFIMNEDVTKDEKLEAACKNALQMLEDAILGTYFLSDDFTLADIHVVPFLMRWRAQLQYAKHYNLESNFPSLAQWYGRCQLRESVRTATISDEKIIEVHKMKIKMLKEKAQS